MPLPKFVEGTNPILAVDGTPTSADDFNEQQQQITDVLKIQHRSLDIGLNAFTEKQANWTHTAFGGPGPPGHWVAASGGSHIIDFPFPGLRAGERITQLDLLLWREVDSEAEGQITIVFFETGSGTGSPGAQNTGWGGTTHWNFGTGGSQWGRTSDAVASPGLIILDNFHYRLRFQAPSTASAHEVRIVHAGYDVQLGN